MHAPSLLLPAFCWQQTSTPLEQAGIFIFLLPTLEAEQMKIATRNFPLAGLRSSRQSTLLLRLHRCSLSVCCAKWPRGQPTGRCTRTRPSRAACPCWCASWTGTARTRCWTSTTRCSRLRRRAWTRFGRRAPPPAGGAPCARTARPWACPRGMTWATARRGEKASSRRAPNQRPPPHAPTQVGHNALGCGQLIAQGASLVDKALADGSLVAGDGWKYVSQAFAEHTLHLIGLLSSGGVHSRDNQLFARAPLFLSFALSFAHSAPPSAPRRPEVGRQARAGPHPAGRAGRARRQQRGGHG